MVDLNDPEIRKAIATGVVLGESLKDSGHDHGSGLEEDRSGSDIMPDADRYDFDYDYGSYDGGTSPVWYLVGWGIAILIVVIAYIVLM